MSSYRTITVNASLSKAQIDVPSTALSGNIAASAEIATPVKHSIVLDYNALENKPEINSVELVGNKTLPEIGVNSISNIDLENLLT
jgi:hypothetical protein